VNRVFNRRDQTAKRRQLRAAMPHAERLLWTQLREQRLGVKFRRQVSVGAFVLDFYCPRCAWRWKLTAPRTKTTQQRFTMPRASKLSKR